MTVKDLVKKKVNQKVSQPKFVLVPPEDGWGFVVTGSVSIIFICCIVPLAGFGIVYGPFLATIGDETSGTTIANGIYNTAISFTGLAANHLLQRFSCRKVGLLGAVLYFLGCFGSAFATSLVQLVITFGLLQGMGFGLMMPACFTTFNHYFEKRKNMMMSVSQAVVVAVNMVWPAFVAYLMQEYGYRSAVIIMSGISLNNFLAMSALQPVKWHMKKRILSTMDLQNVPQLETGDFKKDSIKRLPVEEPLLEARPAEDPRLHEFKFQKHLLNKSTHSLVSMGSMAASVTNVNAVGQAPTSEKEPRLPEFKLQRHLLNKSSHSLVSMGSMAASVPNLNAAGQDVRNEKESFWSSIAKSMDLGLFKSPVFVNIALGLSLGLTSDLAFMSLLPLVLTNFGFTGEEVTLILTTYFGSDLVCRILLSVLTAVCRVKNRYLFLAGALFSAIFRTAFVMNNTFWWITINAAILGFLRCLIQTPLPLVVAEHYSTDRFVTAFSLYMVVCGFCAMTFGPLIAIVKSVTESDVVVVHVLTVAYLMCAIPWLVEVIWKKLSAKKTST